VHSTHEKFEDTKVVIKSRKSKDRQQPKENGHRDQTTVDKTIHRKLTGFIPKTPLSAIFQLYHGDHF
jgi:hypothetical protein